MIMNRKGIIATLLVLISVTVAVLIQGPIAQPIEYHNFADVRLFLSTPNFFNVLSNLPFIIVGLMGLYSLQISRSVKKVEQVNTAYFIFFIGVFLVGFGSGYYHLWPDNQTLVWDRLPMTLAFMALTSIIVAEYGSVNLAKRILYPLLVLGAASVFYWNYTEMNGAGDLRFYILVQFLPLIALPLILLFMTPKFTHSHSYWWLIFYYLLAKIFEHFDSIIFNILPILSGHSLKHLAAAFGILLLLQGYKKRSDFKRNTQGITR